ncbi:MAG: inosine monophosphate cyclohydrolase [Clostridiales bacterium]|nr:inosine monophosphate cyclohydrolase [Clostridiales bacterium]
MKSIDKFLDNNPYPGRGIIVGKTNDGKKAVIAYFIMGRSENSRNRIFTKTDDGIRTQAYDESKLTDPSLIIYSSVRTIGDVHIVTNGDQTDTVYEYLERGDTFENALRSREFEPDKPNYTPRISGIVTICDDDLSYTLSILKSSNGNPKSCERLFYEYSAPLNGQGKFIHTYKCDGDPLPSFKGEPKTIAINDDIDSFTSLIWNSLNKDNKVSLFVQYIAIDGSGEDCRIVNKNQ